MAAYLLRMKRTTLLAMLRNLETPANVVFDQVGLVEAAVRRNAKTGQDQGRQHQQLIP